MSSGMLCLRKVSSGYLPDLVCVTLHLIMVLAFHHDPEKHLRPRIPDDHPALVFQSFLNAFHRFLELGELVEGFLFSHSDIELHLRKLIEPLLEVMKACPFL